MSEEQITTWATTPGGPEEIITDPSLVALLERELALSTLDPEEKEKIVAARVARNQRIRERAEKQQRARRALASITESSVPEAIDEQKESEDSREEEDSITGFTPTVSPVLAEDDVQAPGAYYEGGGGTPQRPLGEQYDSTAGTISSSSAGLGYYPVDAELVEAGTVGEREIRTEQEREQEDDSRLIAVEVCSGAILRRYFRLSVCLFMSVLGLVGLAAALFSLLGSASSSSNGQLKHSAPTTPTPLTTPAPTPPTPTAPPIGCSTSNCWHQVGSDVDGPYAEYQFGYSVSFSADGTRFAAGANYRGAGSGLVRIYEEKGGDWTQIGFSLPGGWSVSMSGDGKRVAAGVPYYDDDTKGYKTGLTHVFEYISDKWVLLGSPVIGEAGGDLSGVSVSLSYDGSIVAIGAANNYGTNGVINSGHVRVYEFVSNVWTQMGDDMDGEAANDWSGYSVSMSDDGHTIAIGAPENDGVNGRNSGHTRVYKYEGGTWTQRGEDVDGEDEGDRSGYSVSLSADGKIVAVGARRNDNVNGIDCGHVRVFEYNSTAAMWSQLGNDIDGEAGGDGFGRSVSLSSNGTVLAVGADLNNGNGIDSGHVRIYKLDGHVWLQVGGDIDGESEGDEFGDSVSLSGNGSRIVIGAPLNDGNGGRSGQVRVYELNVT